MNAFVPYGSENAFTAFGASAASNLSPYATGLIMRLKGDTAKTFGDGASVSLWSDTSGNGNDASQVVVEYQPIVVFGARNGHAAVRTDGIATFLQTLVTFPVPYTLMMVAQWRSQSNTYARMLDSPANELICYNRSSIAVYPGASVVTNDTTVIPGTNWAACALRVNGAGVAQFFVNGVDRTDGGGKTGADWGQLIIGGGSFGEFAGADFGEVLGYNVAVDDTNIAANFAYFNSEYAL